MIDGTVARKTNSVSKFGAKLDTIANKITGLNLFLLPLTLQFFEVQYSIPIVCAVATFLAIQEAYYISLSEIV